MKHQLDPWMETMFLLFVGNWEEKDRTEAIAELDNLGIDGTSFYNRHYILIEKYYREFQKHKIESPGAEYLTGMDEFLVSVCGGIFWQNQDWREGIEDVPERKIKKTIEDALAPENESEGDMFTALEEAGLPAETKWKMVLLSQQPKRQLMMIVSAVKENLPAFEKARKLVANEVEVLIDHFSRIVSEPDQNRLLQISHNVIPDAPIIPTLALPLVVLVMGDVSYYGLLSDRVIGGEMDFTREELIIGAKALGEKSKVEILLSLKEGPMFNLAIAERVGLTAATVSHHMNALIVAGFVELDKRDGKVYYQLNSKGIQNFLAGVGRMLL